MPSKPSVISLFYFFLLATEDALIVPPFYGFQDGRREQQQQPGADFIPDFHLLAKVWYYKSRFSKALAGHPYFCQNARIVPLAIA